MTEETATSGRPVTVDRVINWELSVKHRAVARDALRVQEGGRERSTKAAEWDSFVVNRQHCEDPTSKALPETCYLGRG